MFTTPRPNYFESSEGYSVEVLGRTGLTYREADFEMFVDSEVLTGPTGMVVYRDSIARWKPPNDQLNITDKDKERIAQNIIAVFRFQGFEIDII